MVSAGGIIRASHSTPHPTHTPQAGWSEQDAGCWWAGVCRNTRALLDRHPGFRERITGIGVSGHMLGCLPLDARGRPLRRGLIHSDCRSVREVIRVRDLVGAASVYRLTGNVLDPRSVLCKMLWLKAHEPEIYRRTARFVQSKDYITGCLTGTHDSTDLSDASHAQWLDVKRKVYATDLLQTLGLDANRLPALHRGTEVVGKLCPTAAHALGLPDGIPVVAGGGDGACANVGAGAVRPGDVYCCLGTTAWIACVGARPLLDPQARLFNILALDGAGCAIYGTVQSAGRCVDWIMNLLGERDFSRLDRLLSAAPAGSDGLIFLPYLEGERSPIWDASARGVFFGLHPAHQRSHLVRSCVEGVCLALVSILHILRETRTIKSLRLIGGGSRSVAWQQMLADIGNVGVGVLSVQAADATSLGAAVAAGVGVGLFADLAEGVRALRVREIRRPNPRLRALYAARLSLFESLYPCLQESFARLQRSMPK